MVEKYIGIIIFLCLLNSTLYSQENKPSYFGHRDRNPSINAVGIAVGVQL